MAFNFSGTQKRQKITLLMWDSAIVEFWTNCELYISTTHNKNITDSLGRDLGVNLIRVVLLFPKTSRNDLENKSSEA